MSRVIIFDAVHTILRPMPDVLSAYFLAGRHFGSELSKKELKQRFKAGRRKHFGNGTNAEETQPGSLPSSDAIEFQLWRNLVGDVFADVDPIEPLFQRLWNHFASPKNWQLYDDVEPCWRALNQGGARLVVASNFDSRLHEIFARQEISGLANAVFCSGEIGYRKPDPKFYDVVAESLGLEVTDEVIMVGDDFENDYAAPVAFGWKALHLDRRDGIEAKPHMISSLTQLS